MEAAETRSGCSRLVAPLIPVFTFLIFAVPVITGSLPVMLAQSTVGKLAWLCVAPFTVSLSFILVTGLLARACKSGVVAGKYPRNLKHPVYGRRRLYGLCWTAMYYSGPIYQLVLTTPLLKRLMLRLFGYRGSLDITLYSDTWIRDLPLLDLGAGAYLSNKSTIGTNICLQNGDILVDKITIGRQAMIGHLAMLGPGAVIGDNAEVGVGVAFGIKARLGSGGRIGPGCCINHGAKLGANVEIGSMAYIGVCARIAEGIKIPEGTIIPSRAVIETQDDVRRYVSRVDRHQPVEGRANMETSKPVETITVPRTPSREVASVSAPARLSL